MYYVPLLTFAILVGCNSPSIIPKDKQAILPEKSENFLQDKVWHWQGSYYNNDTFVKPTNDNLYQVTFTKEGKLHILADCNRANTTYSETEKRLNISPQYISTRAFCGEKSFDSQFLKDLMRVNYWLMHEDKLILELDGHSGRMEFQAK